MRITDINVSVGNRDATGKLIEAEDLLKMMDGNHIGHAVAYHEHALLDPMDGNGKMMELAAASKERLEACAVLDPVLGKDNLPGNGSLANRLKNAGIRCIRIFPEHLKMIFYPLYWKEILTAANDLELAFIIDEDYSGEFFARLPKIARSYPKIKFILLRCGLWRSRYIFPLIAGYKNVFFTAEHMLDYKQIEEICSRGGADQLLFGTGYPKLPVEGALGLTFYADISEEEREKILYKNWERIRA